MICLCLSCIDLFFLRFSRLRYEFRVCIDIHHVIDYAFQDMRRDLEHVAGTMYIMSHIHHHESKVSMATNTTVETCLSFYSKHGSERTREHRERVTWIYQGRPLKLRTRQKPERERKDVWETMVGRGSLLGLTQ
ncbi:hypothetical protein M404DRAFT_388669 [Pisolithus tinctorius Marx 270]|uniref:Uncharacterized protein n=1 Tax=Pisolithus tinctorius Marx 270 TaxID=870435 RepID=A0A0C3P3G6_PISTI|nr:hypothetical protein M404DRAFT_388669 [Pisolithus tinctorius Marx 270]